MSDAITAPKDTAEHLDKCAQLLPDELPLPDEIAHLTQDDRKRLERRLTRRLDVTMMPVVFILFLLNILDRNNIASAKIVGLTDTLGMTNEQYNTCLLMFYVGYCITQVPSNMIIGKVRPSYYICLVTSLWGVLSMSQGFTKTFSQLAAEWRIRRENAGIVDEDVESIWWGLQQALKDPKLYMFVVMQMALITAQSFNNFFPSIIGTLGFDSTKTLLLTSPPYFFAFFVSLAVSFHASHKHERGCHIAVPMAFALLGNLLAMFVPTNGGRYFSMFLMTAGAYAPYNLCVSWVSASLPRPRSKRAAALAIVNFMSAGMAHWYTAYMFPDSQKPRYYAGGGVMSGACVVCGGMAIYIK
ncbi:hypothetical protein LQW54_004882 [Pestalotiopsis sp. IQ-011]